MQTSVLFCELKDVITREQCRDEMSENHKETSVGKELK